eukprot:COSAG02_NODE_7682_length_2896_cov_1.909903_1_plen_100_part_00
MKLSQLLRQASVGALRIFDNDKYVLGDNYMYHIAAKAYQVPTCSGPRSTARVGGQATLSVGTYGMVRVGETRPSAGMYRYRQKSPFSPRSPHVVARQSA